MASKSIIFLGATGAVGGEALKTLLGMPSVLRISTLGRSEIPNMRDVRVKQHKINIFEPDSYGNLVSGHEIAICTLGVGEPSKASREDFIKIDKTAVIDFAKKCEAAGVQHFQLLASVGINAESRNFYLKAKGELVDELKKLSFTRLSIFMPSMIITPHNRYGFSQAVFLRVWPIVSPLMIGGLKKYRGIKVDELGAAIAHNIETEKSGYEELTWTDFQEL